MNIRTLRIQLTNRCNLNCLYCCNEGTRNDYSIITDRNMVAFIHACRSVLDIKRVKFTGGEPMMYDGSIAKIISQVNRPDIQYSIVTNGTDLDLAALANMSNIEVTISLPTPPDDFSTFKKIAGISDQNQYNNIFENISRITMLRKQVKINYVLCNGKNTDPMQINNVLLFAKQNKYISLRFLETVINSTNNRNNRMMKFVFPEERFINILQQTKDFQTFNYTEPDIKSSAMLIDNAGFKIKLIRSFCSLDCTSCPADKTSLWLTSTGRIKTCSYRTFSIPIDNWSQAAICKQLDNLHLISNKASLDL